MELSVIIFLFLSIFITVIYYRAKVNDLKYQLSTEKTIKQSLRETIAYNDQSRSKYLHLANDRLKAQKYCLDYILYCMRENKVPHKANLEKLINESPDLNYLNVKYIPKVIINHTGGNFQWAQSNTPVKVVILDSDTEGADKEELCTWTNDEGKKYTDYLIYPDPEILQASTERIFKEVLA